MSAGLEPWSQYTNFILTLIAVLDPFMAIPVFLGMRAGRSEAEHRRLARVASLIVLAVLVAAALSGSALLTVLGTSMASFRVAGGLVLLLMALAMLQARVDTKLAELSSGAENDIAVVVPLAIPLLAGPGAISAVMIAAQDGSFLHQSVIIAAIVLVCLIIWLTLRLAEPISRVLGAAGLNIANRLLGLLLAAIAVESMASGLRQLFPALEGL
jgi:multiple antibiotic resistance protein